MAKRNTQFRGCKDVVFAIVTKDDATGITFGTPESLGVCKSISRTFEQSSETIFGDNKAQLITTSAGKVAKTFEMMAIDPEVIAKITGQKVVDVGGKKAIITISGAVAPYVAIGYKLYDTDSDEIPCEYVWCYKGKAKTPEKKASTIDDGTTSEGQSIEFEFVETEYEFTIDGAKSGAVDFAVPHIDTLDMSKWTSSVVTPENVTTALSK